MRYRAITPPRNFFSEISNKAKRKELAIQVRAGGTLLPVDPGEDHLKTVGVGSGPGVGAKRGCLGLISPLLLLLTPTTLDQQE